MIRLAEIHPMLVHFPVVFIFTAWVLLALAMLRAEGLARDPALLTVGLVFDILAGAFAVITAMSGDLALDIAIERGFKTPFLEVHEELGIATAVLLALNMCLAAYFLWRKSRLNRTRSWYVFGLTSIGALMVLVTAYYGGYLVYGLGVNVIPVRP